MPGGRLKDCLLGHSQTAGQPKGEGQPGQGRESENHGKGVTGQLDRGYDIQRRGKPKARAREKENGEDGKQFQLSAQRGQPTHYIPGVIITTSPPLNTIRPGHHLPLQPPSTPSSPFHAPPRPYQPRARLQRSHPCIPLFPITATLISPPPTLPNQTSIPYSTSLTVSSSLSRHPASSSHPYETHLSSRVHVLQKTPKRNAPLPFPGRWWSTPPKIPKNHAQTKSSLYQTHNPIFNTLTQCTTPPPPIVPRTH